MMSARPASRESDPACPGTIRRRECLSAPPAIPRETVGAVADQQQFGRNLLAHAVEDLDDIGDPLHRTKIGKMHQNALAVRRVFAAQFRPLSSRQYTSQFTKL
jgi:hypothetical protein